MTGEVRPTVSRAKTCPGTPTAQEGHTTAVAEPRSNESQAKNAPITASMMSMARREEETELGTKRKEEPELELLERRDEAISHINAISGTAAIVISPLSTIFMLPASFSIAATMASGVIFLASYMMHVKLKAKIKLNLRLRHHEGTYDWDCQDDAERSCRKDQYQYKNPLTLAMDIAISILADTITSNYAVCPAYPQP